MTIDFNDTSDIYLSEYMNDETRYFDIKAYNDYDEFDNELEYISENPNVATVEYKQSYTSYCCIINRVGAGETYIYVQTNDGTVQSEKIKVISAADEPEVPILDETENLAIDETENNDKIVYITPYGKKYHYRESCAGDNAMETTEDSAKMSHDPCKKCVG